VLPIGDYPNPRAAQWVTRILVAANIAIHLLVAVPLRGRLEEADLKRASGQLDAMWQVQAPAVQEQYEEAYRRGKIPIIPPPELQRLAWTRNLTKYSLVVDRYGYKPGKPWLLALLTCMFLHADLVHLGGNMLMLWIFGDNVEARLGRLGYLVGYLAAGVLGTLAFSLAYAKSLTPLVGASGAISGVLGFYLIWFPRNQVRVVILFFYIMFIHIRALWVLLVFLVWENILPFLFEARRGGSGGVAHGAHIGGFVAGMVGALLWDLLRGRVRAPSPYPYMERRPMPWNRPRPVPGGAADAFHAAVRMGRMEEAAHAFTRHVTDGGVPPRPEDVFALARWLYENGFSNDAVAVFRYYLANYPRGEDSDRVHLGLGALLGRFLGQPVSARQHLFAAIDLARDPSVAARAKEELAALG
jgi:membrane associated rhomboid family serine protease